MGGPFVGAKITSPGTPVRDDGGSALPGTGTPTERTCSVQVDVCTEAMRASEGYRDRDVRILVLAGTIDGAVTTSQKVVILSGEHAGTWSIESADRDPAGLGWDLRGRRA